jgi:GxxExxY protein
MTRRGFRVENQVPCLVVYQNTFLEAGFRIDLLVEDCLIVEMKAVKQILPMLFP